MEVSNLHSQKVIEQRNNLFSNDIQRGQRNGVEIEKGVVLNEDFLRKIFTPLGETISIWSAYPDIFLDLITKFLGNTIQQKHNRD